MDLLIKVYFKNENFPIGGKLSQFIHESKLGSKIEIRGPFGRIQYLGDGVARITQKYKPLTIMEKTYSRIGMLAAGTGITPMYQILLAAERNNDKCKEFVLFFGNRTSKDILLRQELENMSKEMKFNFKLILMIDSHEEGWQGEVGHFNKENISKYMPKVDDATLILTCGPPKLCRDVLLPALKELGYSKENIFDY